MKLAALGVLAIAVVWWLNRQRSAERMSRDWLEQQRREGRLGERAGVDGVCWDWPVKKQHDEMGWKNRRDFRKRA